MECFSYKGVHGMRGCHMHTKAFKGRVGLGYRLTTSGNIMLFKSLCHWGSKV